MELTLAKTALSRHFAADGKVILLTVLLKDASMRSAASGLSISHEQETQLGLRRLHNMHWLRFEVDWEYKAALSLAGRSMRYILIRVAANVLSYWNAAGCFLKRGNTQRKFGISARKPNVL
jgi:hypothetical protein